MNLGLGALGAVVLYFAADAILARAVTMTPEVRAEVGASLLPIAVLLPLAMVNGVFIGALELNERFVLANVLTLVTVSLGQILPVVFAVLVSPSLAIVIPVAVAARAAGVLATFVLVAREEGPELRLRFSMRKLRELLGYGSWLSVSAIVSPLLVSLDQIVIGKLLDAGAVAHYAVPKNLITRTQVLAAALSRTLFPRLSRHSPEEARDLAERATITLAFAFGGCCAVGIVLVRPFLSLWIGPDFAAAVGQVGEILLFGAWINGLAFVPYSMLLGQGRPDVTAKLHLLQIVPFAILLVGLTGRFGLEGAAWAWTARVCADAAFLYAVAGFRPRIWIRTGIAGLVLIAAWLATMLNGDLVAAVVTACLIGLAALGLGLAYDPTGRGFAKAALRRLRS